MRAKSSSTMSGDSPILLPGCTSAPDRLLSEIARNLHPYLETRRVVIETVDHLGNSRVFPVVLIGIDERSAFTIRDQMLVVYPLRSIVCGYRVDDAAEVVELRYLRRRYDA